MARRSQVSSRLLDVLDPTRQRGAVGPKVVLATAVACAVVLFPLASLAPRLDAVNTNQTGPAATAPMPTIVARNDEFMDAVRRRDTKAIAELYTSDAMMVNQGHPPVRGRQAVRARYEWAIDHGMDDAEIRVQEVHAVGDMIFDVGRGTVLTR